MPSTQHETVITLAQRHINAKDYSAAVSVLAPHLRDHPEDVDALNVIALAHFQMAKFPAARSAYLQMWSRAYRP